MNKNESVSVSRRRFLSQLGGLTALGMFGPSLLVARDARATTATAASATQEDPDRLPLGRHPRHGGGWPLRRRQAL